MNARARQRRRANSARRLGSLLACGVATVLGACHEDVKLGGWHDAPVASLSSTSAGTSAGTGGATATLGTALTTSSSLATSSSATDGGPGAGGAAGDTNAPPALPACLASATPGAINTPGPNPVVYPTELATDWTWPEPVPSMQWEIMVEREVVNPPSPEQPTIGYYYTHEFWFQEGIKGFLGIQAEGGYSAQGYDGDPWTKIAVFWLAAETAELGEISAPNARVGMDEANGVEYLTIHALFDWQACRVYRFRIALDSTLPDGRTWYGAWIEDVEADDETFLGRMLLPAGAGMLTPFSTSRTHSIDFMNARGCQYAQHASVLFGTPSSGDGLVRPTGVPRFAALGCPSSRFTVMDGAIRHEIMSSSAP